MRRPAFLVPHTHWDREWYRTFQQFRLDLVRTVDLVLDTLDRDADFAHFLLDGQTIVIDDYLAIRPERAADLRAMIAAGRLAIGPWYCHPDLFLVSGEALVRNLMLGLRTARAYRDGLMVGYIPDQFGHTGQMPQIFQSMGITSAVLWRGVDAGTTRNESLWEAPDGSRVFLQLLAQSYSNAQMLPLEPAALAARLRQLCELQAANATGPGVLLMNGNDHLPIQPGLPKALATANELLAPDWQVEITSLDEAIARLRADGHPDEQVLRGELRSPATAHLLPGVLSTRIPQIKQRNVRAQLLLEREAEPYAAWATLLGTPYPFGELWEAWRLLLQNQPHDSVCGCSIDQVHREMGIRYDGVEQITGELITRSLGQLVTHIDSRLADNAPPHSVPVVIVNSCAGPRTDRVRLQLQLPGVAEGYQVFDAQGQSVPHRWLGARGEPSTVMGVPRESIPSVDVMMAQIEGNRVMGMGLQSLTNHMADDGLHFEAMVGTSGIMPREQLEVALQGMSARLAETDPIPVTVHLHYNAQLDLELLARDVPGCGYMTLWLQPVDAETLSAPVESSSVAETSTTDHAIDNEFFAVHADPATGALTITDRRNGAVYGPCNIFSDSGDAGDSYTYAPPATDRLIDRPDTPPDIEVTRDALGGSLRITQQMSVPAGLTDDRSARAEQTIPLQISSIVTLTTGCPRIDVMTTVANSATDHRLRVSFQVPFELDHVEAEGAFEVVRRPLGALAMQGTALEDPVPTAPQHGFAILQDDARGLVVANIGLPEYEAEAIGPGTTVLSLTLLRCIGWLSRDDLPTRRGGAGPSLPVPEAQCAGTSTFTYSLIPFDGNRGEAIEETRRAQVALRALSPVPTHGTLPPTGSLISVDAPGLLISAVKGAEDGRGIVVRLYNITADTVKATLRLMRPIISAERVSLDERPLDTLHDGAPCDALPFEVGPYRIETLRLVVDGA